MKRLATKTQFLDEPEITRVSAGDPHRSNYYRSVSTLRVHPSADGASTLYDDDGKSLGYLNGSDPKTVWLRLRWDDKTHRLTIEADARMKEWRGGTRTFLVEVAGSGTAPKRLEFRGQPASIQF